MSSPSFIRFLSFLLSPLAPREAYIDLHIHHPSINEDKVIVPDLPTLQKAVVYDPNEKDKMKYTDKLEVPGVHDGEVMIKVYAAAINPVDANLSRVPLISSLKTAVGTDVSGIVTYSRSPLFNVGDAVYGTAEYGSLCQYVSTRAPLIRKKPEYMSHSLAAASVVVFKTTYEALIERAKLKAGEKILILGGATSCGMIAVQLARAHGASLITSTCSPSNMTHLKSLGCDHVVDYTSVKDDNIKEYNKKLGHVIRELGESYDVIYDTVGSKGAVELSKIVSDNKSSARFVTIRGSIPWFSGANFSMESFLIRANADNLFEAEELIKNDKLKIEINRSYTLSEYSTAFEALKSGRVRGKSVFTISTD